MGAQEPVSTGELILLCAALLLWVASSPVIASDDAVSLYPKEQALRLATQPVAYMVDEMTCERVEGHRLVDGTLAGAGARSALYRLDDRQKPFMRVRTREDGVYVARFPAEPNEVTLSRAYVVDPRTRQFVYGEPTAAQCIAVKARVGDLMPMEE